MTIRGARDLSVPVLLALFGAALCVGSLFMAWVKVDLTALEHWMQTTPELADARAQASMTPEQVHVAMQAMVDAMMSKVGSKFTGWHALKLWMLALQLLSAAFVVAAVARFMNRGGTRARLATELLSSGGILLALAVWTMSHIPQGSVDEIIGGDVLVAATGVKVSIAGALLVVVSGVWAQRASATGLDAQERAEQERAEFMARTGGGGMTPAPGLAGTVPAAAAFATVVPQQPYQPVAPPYPTQTAPAQPYPPQQPAYPPQQPAYAPRPPAPAPAPAQPQPGGSVAPPGFS